VIVDTRGILNDPENWDERLRPRSSTLVDNTHNVRGQTDNGHIDQHVDCNSDRRDTSTRNPGSRLPSSDLTPLDEGGNTNKWCSSIHAVGERRIPGSS